MKHCDAKQAIYNPQLPMEKRSSYLSLLARILASSMKMDYDKFRDMIKSRINVDPERIYDDFRLLLAYEYLEGINTHHCSR